MNTTHNPKTGPGIVAQLQAAALDDDALIGIAIVQTLSGLSRTAIYVRAAAGNFPEPIRMGKRCNRWRRGGIIAWCRKQGGEQ